MWLLTELFDEVVDIATVPVKVATKVTDAVITLWEDEPLTGFVEDIREDVRINK